MFDELSGAYNSMVESFNDLAQTMETTASQLEYVMGAFKISGIIAAIVITILIVLIVAMNTKIDRLRADNEQMNTKLNDILLQVGGYKKSEGGNTHGTTTERDD